jgi:hypothetical protein
VKILLNNIKINRLLLKLRVSDNDKFIYDSSNNYFSKVDYDRYQERKNYELQMRREQEEQRRYDEQVLREQRRLEEQLQELQQQRRRNQRRRQEDSDEEEGYY